MNNEVKLFHYPILRKADPPAYRTAFHAFHEQLRKGYLTLADAPDPEQPVVIARIDDELVGLITFSQGDHAIHVDVAWVSPKHRRRGVWTTMWSGLTDGIAQWYGYNRIYWPAGVKNKPMHAVLDTLKVSPEFIMYVYNVKESK